MSDAVIATGGFMAQYSFRLIVTMSSFGSAINNRGGGTMFPSIRCPLSINTAISLYLVEVFHCNLSHYVSGHCCKGFQGQRGQRSRLWPDQLTYNGTGKHFDGVGRGSILLIFNYLFVVMT